MPLLRNTLNRDVILSSSYLLLSLILNVVERGDTVSINKGGAQSPSFDMSMRILIGRIHSEALNVLNGREYWSS